MDIKITTKDKINLNYDKCPNCNNHFNSTKRKKTSNHAIPQFLNPKTIITHSLCESCHKELNSYYKLQKIKCEKNKIESKTFEEFKINYEDLRDLFHEKKINRGQFGEGLWGNIVSYLEEADKRIKELEEVTQIEEKD